MNRLDMLTHNAIQIDIDINSYNRFKCLTRLVWIFLFMFLLISTFGFTGSGPLNKLNAETREYNFHYSPFARLESPTKLKFIIKDTIEKSDVLTISIDKILDHYIIESIIPEPKSTSIQSSKTIYSFNSKQANAEIVFNLRPSLSGRVNGEIEINSLDGISFSQFIYP